MERIDKILAHQGFGSRKDIKKLLRNEDVFVNGKQVFDPSFQIDTQKDALSINGEILTLHGHLYIMMNKIAGTVCTKKNGEHRTVYDLLADDLQTPYLQEKLHAVGRLDMDTEGLLLFTTDGELTHKIISPKTHVSKTYLCVLEHDEDDGHFGQVQKRFLEGIEVGAEGNEAGFLAKPAQCVRATKEELAFYANYGAAGSASGCTTGRAEEGALQEECRTSTCAYPVSLKNTAVLTISEGKYHQVKRMFAAVGNKVVYLKRIAMGNLFLDADLETGKYKMLSLEEVGKLL